MTKRASKTDYRRRLEVFQKGKRKATTNFGKNKAELEVWLKC
jgi:hypothetical protein